MAKKKEVQSQDDFEAELQSTPKVFDTPMLGISKKSDGGYNIVKVMIDARTLETTEVEVLETAETKWEANEKFKINVIKQGIL